MPIRLCAAMSANAENVLLLLDVLWHTFFGDVLANANNSFKKHSEYPFLYTSKYNETPSLRGKVEQRGYRVLNLKQQTNTVTS
jgi:hypothetical protein